MEPVPLYHPLLKEKKILDYREPKDLPPLSLPHLPKESLEGVPDEMSGEVPSGLGEVRVHRVEVVQLLIPVSPVSVVLVLLLPKEAPGPVLRQVV